MDAADLEHQIVALLAADSNDDELQMSLVEIVGFDDLDFVIELISHRKEILSDQSTSMKQTDGLFANLQSREEREKTLRRQDMEHKHTSLSAVGTSRSASRE